STCAIYSEYLRAQYPQGLNPSEPEHVRLATALMHGLRSDTLDLLAVLYPVRQRNRACRSSIRRAGAGFVRGRSLCGTVKNGYAATNENARAPTHRQKWAWICGTKRPAEASPSDEPTTSVRAR